MNGHKVKVWFATQLYRWSMAQSIVGAMFSAMTWAGVFTLLLGPVFQQWGLGYSSTLFLLLAIVLTVFFGIGVTLDRVVRFWAAQAQVGTIRNPWLLNRLYEKEYLSLKTNHIPVVTALRELLADSGKHPELVVMLDENLERLKKTVEDKRWTIESGENVYEDSY